MVYSKKFPSGLRMVVKQMEGLYSVSMGAVVGTGSCFETAKENGISHFIEHMMFKGTNKRTAFEISDAMDRIGAQVNAFTSKDVTCYYAKATSGHAGEAFEILADFVLNSVFPEEEMDREKGVVLEEIAMTEDTPDDLCSDVLARAYFGDAGYGRTILGPSSNVKKFTRADLLAYVAERYAPENVVISFAGNIDVAYAEELVEKYFESALQKRAFVPRKKEISLCGENLYKYKDIEQAHISLAYTTLARDHELAEAVQILNVILGGSMSSRLFQRVREQLGLAYSVYSFPVFFTEGGMLTVYAGVNPANIEKAKEAIVQTIERFCRDKFTQEEFLSGKEQILSSLVFSQESTASQMIQYGKYMISNDAVFDMEARVNKISSLTMDDCVRALEMNFKSENMASAVVGKVKTPLTF